MFGKLQYDRSFGGNLISYSSAFWHVAQMQVTRRGGQSPEQNTGFRACLHHLLMNLIDKSISMRAKGHIAVQENGCAGSP